MRSNLKIVFLDTATTTGEDLSLDSLKNYGTFIHYERTAPDEIIERAKDADILIVNKVVIDKKVIDACPHLRYILVSATGYNNVNIDYARQVEIPVSNVKGYSTEGVVQHVFSLILKGLNQVDYYNQEVKENRWNSSEDFCFYDHSIRELNGKTLGIYGLGTIGSRVVQVGQAFGMNAIAYHPDPNSLIHPVAQLVDQDELLSRSDILSLHAPLNEASRHFINADSLKKMKRGSILINTARGGVVDENALANSLKENHLSFAGIDTLPEEPPTKGSPLIGLENCFVTPHIAWATYDSRQRLISRLEENIKAFFAGKINNQVN